MKPTKSKRFYSGEKRSTSRPAAALMALTMIGCGSLSATAQDLPDPNDPPQFDKLITIHYAAKGGCNSAPVFVDMPFFEVNKGEKIGWKSADGTTAFKIYFSPFAGDVINGTNGQTPPQTIPQEPPAGVTYKYTIVTDAEACKDYPLDPYFRVR
jgi:uncharacterized protein YceK